MNTYTSLASKMIRCGLGEGSLHWSRMRKLAGMSAGVCLVAAGFWMFVWANWSQSAFVPMVACFFASGIFFGLERKAARRQRAWERIDRALELYDANFRELMRSFELSEGDSYLEKRPSCFSRIDFCMDQYLASLRELCRELKSKDL